MNYEEKIKDLFKNSYTEINKNHDEAVRAFENFCNINNRKIPVMINYDTHSDVYLNSKQISENIANWVNFCFSRLGVIDYYWIIPHYIICDSVFKKTFENNEKLQQETFQSGAMRAFGNLDDVVNEKFLLNKETSELITAKKLDIINEKNKKFGLTTINALDEGFIPVSLHIVPFNKISILENKEIALSIDGDSFCNSGHDTIGAINNVNITSQELKKEFELFINELYVNKIKILTTSLTRSPAYFPPKFEKELNEFYEQIKAASLYRKSPSVINNSCAM